jgi:hypothetical protein
MQNTCWLQYEVGNTTRWKLFVDGIEEPWFVDRGKYDKGPNGERYGLFGSGMHGAGCAANFAYFPKPKDAQARAIGTPHWIQRLQMSGS